MNAEYGYTPSPWKTAHDRIGQASQDLRRVFELTEKENAEILKSRAGSLARPPEPEKDTGPFIHVVAFRLAREEYAIESRYVREVQMVQRFTPLPFTPSFVLGVTGLHGRITSVVDLREFFGLSRIGLGDPKRLLVIEGEDMRFGILVDGFEGTSSIPVGRLQDSIHTITDARENYVRGVTAERVIVLDGKRLLTDSRIVVSDGARQWSQE